jgi:hypothetical protein
MTRALWALPALPTVAATVTIKPTGRTTGGSPSQVARMHALPRGVNSASALHRRGACKAEPAGCQDHGRGSVATLIAYRAAAWMPAWHTAMLRRSVSVSMRGFTAMTCADQSHIHKRVSVRDGVDKRACRAVAAAVCLRVCECLHTDTVTVLRLGQICHTHKHGRKDGEGSDYQSSSGRVRMAEA